MQNSGKLLLFLTVQLALFSCGSEDQTLVPGVSLELAEARKAAISDLEYMLDFDIPAAAGAPISGRVTIDFVLTDSPKPVLLDFNVDQPQVSKLTVNGEQATFELINEKIVVPIDFFSPGNNSVFIEFVAGETGLNRNEDYLYTLFVPDRASTVFPCFDQPNLKGSYELTLTTPAAWKAITNGAIIEESIAGGRKTSHFAKTKPISTYLFAFSTGVFQEIQRVVDGRPMTMLHRETDSLKVVRNLDEIFHLHKVAIDWLEDYTGIAYPFGKFGFALIPSFQYGGMEHPGAITYKASSLFLDESATQNQLLRRASLIAHETAHMWFGDLVTMSWFSDVWMKEVFANFMAAKIVHPSFPEVNHDLRFLLAHYPGAYAVDRSQGTHSIQQPLANLKNAGTLYGAIIYQKAPIVMRKLERRIGAEPMRAGLQEYLSTYSYNNATWDDLIVILDTKSTDDIIGWSNQWVKKKGMPFVTSWLDTRKDSTIKRMTIFQRGMPEGDDLWPQMVTVKMIAKDSLYSMDLDLQEHNTALTEAKGLPEPNFILANAGGYGYGYFRLGPLTSRRLLDKMDEFEDPIMRGSGWLNLWESLVRGGIAPAKLLTALQYHIPKEPEQLMVQRQLNYLNTLYWKFLSPPDRLAAADSIEQLVWQQLEATDNPREKAVFFSTYRSIVLSEAGVQILLKIWRESMEVPGLHLSENDFTSMAYALALRLPGQSEAILREQLSRINNVDRQARMKFILPALSPDQAARDAFFESLKLAENRARESWVQQAVGFLHHPLRAEQSIAYITPTLEMLEEIQLTGDIFFPKRMLDNTFRGHQSPEAVDAVRQFLYRNNHYPENLKNKILQASDLTFRAAEILESQEDEDKIIL